MYVRWQAVTPKLLNIYNLNFVIGICGGGRPVCITTGSQYRDMVGTHPESCPLGTWVPLDPHDLLSYGYQRLAGSLSLARSSGRDMKPTIRLQIVKNVWRYTSTPL